MLQSQILTHLDHTFTPRHLKRALHTVGASCLDSCNQCVPTPFQGAPSAQRHVPPLL
jgi:hypothetical protein